LIDRFRDIVGTDGVLTAASDRMVYECDGYTIEKSVPDVVVLPRNRDEVVALVKLCAGEGIPFVPRGAGTSLAGGTVPVGGGVMITLTRMNRILEVDLRNRYAIVEPGVVNAWVTARLKGTGFHYAPDPSSQGACTIGGNVATNSGGPHTLKYGVTVNHVLGAEFILPDGEVIQFGGPAEDNPGLDLVGLVVGNEGTFGICTKVWIRITPDPQGYRTLLGVFETADDASKTISDIIAAGIVPAALEMMDQLIVRAIEDAFHFGFPLDAGAVLIMEVDGIEAGLDAAADRITAIAKANNAREVKLAHDENERLLLWKSRKKAFGAIGRLSPSYCCQDGVVPRSRLPEMLRFIADVGRRHDIQIANVFHAGDGNMHPILLFDERDGDQVHRVLAASHEILAQCIEMGGSVTGEHGIGVEKIEFMDKLFSASDLNAMTAVREVFNPEGRCNPHKMLPAGGHCVEVGLPALRRAT
jgi:glycolate oxidase